MISGDGRDKAGATPAEALDELRRRIAEEACAAVHPAVAAVAERARERHGRGVAAVLFYGSCLRQGESLDIEGSLLDLYVLVDRYRDAYANPLTAFGNRLLPPNVFYVEVPWRGRRVRAKYAVVARDQFRRGVRSRWQVTFWARFAQPARLVWARDAAARDEAIEALAASVTGFASRALPLLDGAPFTAESLWRRGLEATYRAELRAETGERADRFAGLDRARNADLTPLALRAAGVGLADEGGRWRSLADAAAGRRERRRWAARPWIGKPLNVLRLVKGVFTFDGGVDYILYKIERHAGRRPEVTQWERRHPILAAPFLLWRLARGGFIR